MARATSSLPAPLSPVTSTVSPLATSTSRKLAPVDGLEIRDRRTVLPFTPLDGTAAAQRERRPMSKTNLNLCCPGWQPKLTKHPPT
jgi:hypothetical protein